MKKYRSYIFSVIMAIIIIVGYECIKESIAQGIGKTGNFIALLVSIAYMIAPIWVIGYGLEEDLKEENKEMK